MSRARRSSRRPELEHQLPVVAGLLALTVAAPGVAIAAQLPLTSARLATTSLVPPPFHLTALTTTAAGTNTQRPSQGDVLVARFSQRLDAGSVCPGAPATAPQTLNGVTVELVDGGAGPDLLLVGAGPAECRNPQEVNFTLGSTAYNAGTVINFANSSITLRFDTGTTSTLTVTLGTPSRLPAAVGTATVVTVSPDPTLRDTSGRAISPGTAATTSKVQF